MTLTYSLAEAVLAEPKNFIFLNKNVILYPTLWRTALSWSRKRLHPPGNFRNVSKSHHSFLFRTGTEAKGLEGETAVGHPTSDGDVRDNMFKAFKPQVGARSPCSSRTRAPLLRSAVGLLRHSRGRGTRSLCGAGRPSRALARPPAPILTAGFSGQWSEVSAWLRTQDASQTVASRALRAPFRQLLGSHGSSIHEGRIYQSPADQLSC